MEKETNRAIAGKEKKLIFRLAAERAFKKAGILALQVTHTYKNESKTESTPTKDGPVVSGGGNEPSIELEALLSDSLICRMLEYAQATGSEVEVWEVNLMKPLGNGKYEARYGTGLIESWEMPAEMGANSSVKTTMKLNGSFDFLKSGATLDAEQEAAVKALGYDTVANPTAEDLVPVYQPVTGEEGKLLQAKNEAVKEISEMAPLSDKQKETYISKVTDAASAQAVQTAVTEAKKLVKP